MLNVIKDGDSRNGENGVKLTPSSSRLLSSGYSRNNSKKSLSNFDFFKKFLNISSLSNATLCDSNFS